MEEFHVLQQKLIRYRHITRFFALLAAFALATQAADAQEKAFKLGGEGVAPHGLPLPGQAPRSHWILGNATHLGLHTGDGTVQTVTADFSEFPARITGTFGSGTPYVFVGANGDQLVCDYGRSATGDFEGHYELTTVGVDRDGNLIVTALFIAEFVPRPDDSTGRFAGVTGSWTMIAATKPFVLGSTDPLEYQWDGEGKLTFLKGKK
ncbi:MAG: hypothetical protein CMJ48_10415 [Planctomycetaceae bacterium]|nr:hypothetical protein [Planctomycetaceae bacterium]